MKNKTALPFSLSKTENFFDQLGNYIGDVFYDILPEMGFELRDEQIFMAYQLEQAFKNRNVIFAEAGVGTGKTFVYLLYAICYARYKGKPAIISCADETLIEQLVKKNGDIEKLEKALELTIDARLAKARDQYLCVKKLDNLIHQQKNDKDLLRIHHELPNFVFNNSHASMTSFEKYGDRKDYPLLSNETWTQIAWDPVQQCSTCDFRHRCAQTLHRQHYRDAIDLVICSHDFYMEHVWTKESRQREGQLPLLPEASCVVFDEGHLLEFAAQKGLTYRFHSETLNTMLTAYFNQDIREETLYLIEDILALHEEWFDQLKSYATYIEGSERMEVLRTNNLVDIAQTLHAKVTKLLDQLVFDSELFVMEDYHLKIIEEYLEFYSYGLSVLLAKDRGIYWLEESNTEVTFVVMPRLVENVLKQEVFSQTIPFVFSSATLSKSGDFSYMANSLGVESYQFFSVSSPFDYHTQMEVKVHTEETRMDKWEQVANDLIKNNGKTLILFSSEKEMNQFRQYASEPTKEWNFPILYEGDEEISYLVKAFQENEGTVLCSHHLWEGLDVPGPSLSQVIIYSLPFPPKDPVFQAKRNYVENPLEDVDLPYMLLRLRQGIGRLIRIKEDKGTIHIWLTKEEKTDYYKEIIGVLPVTP